MRGQCNKTPVTTIMKNQLDKFSWLATGLLTLTAISYNSNLAVLAQTNSNNQNKYPQSFVSEYMATCLQRATQEGLEESDRLQLCNCTLSRFQARYSMEQLKKLSQSTREDIGYQCLNEILYEDK
jgi:hypothetical protein